jgi:hypothetical protein
MTDFWRASGFHLLTVDRDGKLGVTDDYLRAFFARPEIAPVAESCDAERALHHAILTDPRQPIDAGRLDLLADSDARDNYAVVLGFRDHLVRHGTIEAAYLALFRHGKIDVPPLFVDQMAHVLLRNILADCTDPIQLRAAELFFRSQKVSVKDEAILLADEDIVEMHATTGGFGSIGQLLGESGATMRSVDLDILERANGALYWARSDQFDTVLDMRFMRPGLDALCRVIEAWVLHLLGVATRVQPVPSIKDEHWVWHVGLDIESSAILNDLYNDVEVEEDAMARLLALFRLEFEEPSLMLPRVAGRPVYLGMAMTPGKVLRFKPQNLLVNLPLAVNS